MNHRKESYQKRKKKKKNILCNYILWHFEIITNDNVYVSYDIDQPQRTPRVFYEQQSELTPTTTITSLLITIHNLFHIYNNCLSKDTYQSQQSLQSFILLCFQYTKCIPMINNALSTSVHNTSHFTGYIIKCFRDMKFY